MNARQDDGFLAGIRVLDLAGPAGALAGKLLAGLGADVVLAEPEDGSPLRGVPPFVGQRPHAARSLFFAFYAAGKRSVRATPDRLARLAAAADVLVETGTPGSWRRWHERNPRLVIASITPFGQTGPYVDWRATDLVAQATGGMLALNGHPDRRPQQALGLQAYHQAGVLAVVGILAALHARERIGAGQLIDVSLQAAAAASLEHLGATFDGAGRRARRTGSTHWTGFFRTVRCRDGHLVVSTLGDWTTLREWLRADGVADPALDDPHLEDPAVRQARADELFAALERWAASRDAVELYERAQLLRLPWAVVRPPEAALHDAHLARRGFFVSVADPTLGIPLRHPGSPFRARDVPWVVRQPPGLGEHEQAVDRQWVAQEPARCPPAAATPRVAPLAGVRVLDFTWVVAGPIATRLLADLGADVIKVEPPWADRAGDRRGGLVGSLNRGKRSIVIDLRRPAGRDLARRLAARCDVVIDSFSARVMPALGLDFERLRALRPDIVCVRMTGFGLDGPDRDRVSFGPTLQALAGFTALMTGRGEPPAGFGHAYADVAAGHMAAVATLAALRRRARTGEGQEIDLAQQETLLALIGPLLLARALDGAVSEPVGNGSQEAPAAPHGVYPCAGDDRWIAIVVPDDETWRAFARVVGTGTWASDPRFATTAGRLAHAPELDTLVESWTRARQAESIVARLQAAGVPAGRVTDAHDLCTSDPQLAARGYVVSVRTPEGRIVRLDGCPIVLSATPASVRGPGPLLGEHTDAVLSALLGLSAETVARLRAEGVVA